MVLRALLCSGRTGVCMHVLIVLMVLLNLPGCPLAVSGSQSVCTCYGCYGLSVVSPEPLPYGYSRSLHVFLRPRLEFHMDLLVRLLMLELHVQRYHKHQHDMTQFRI